jgi:hypothetical protein
VAAENLLNMRAGLQICCPCRTRIKVRRVPPLGMAPSASAVTGGTEAGRFRGDPPGGRAAPVTARLFPGLVSAGSNSASTSFGAILVARMAFGLVVPPQEKSRPARLFVKLFQLGASAGWIVQLLLTCRRMTSPSLTTPRTGGERM